MLFGINLEKARVLNSFHLKLIAMVTMITDHVGFVLFPDQIILRIIGRLSFPIFCFLLAEGYFHTKNLLRYIFRIAVLALVSEIPFNLMVARAYFYPPHQNIFFTLLIGLVTLFAVDSLLRINRYIPAIILGGLGLLAAQLIRSDYRFKGVAVILIFYLLKKVTDNWMKLFLILAFFFINLEQVQVYALLALIPIYFYNGKRGINSKAIQYLAYLVYPLHLIIILVLLYNA